MITVTVPSECKTAQWDAVLGDRSVVVLAGSSVSFEVPVLIINDPAKTVACIQDPVYGLPMITYEYNPTYSPLPTSLTAIPTEEEISSGTKKTVTLTISPETQHNGIY